MPFGITSAPEHFQRQMGQMLEGIANTSCHMDDIIVWGENRVEHDKTLRQVLNRISQAGMTLNREKTLFHTNEVNYLGHVISEGKIRIDPEKVCAIGEMKPPQSPKEVQSFVGMVNFVSRYIEDCSGVLSPIYDLLKKDVTFVWDVAQQRAFDEIKFKLTHAPILTMYDPNRSTKIMCDASRKGLGAVLMQLVGEK